MFTEMLFTEPVMLGTIRVNLSILSIWEVCIYALLAMSCGIVFMCAGMCGARRSSPTLAILVSWDRSRAHLPRAGFEFFNSIIDESLKMNYLEHSITEVQENVLFFYNVMWFYRIIFTNKPKKFWCSYFNKGIRKK